MVMLEAEEPVQERHEVKIELHPLVSDEVLNISISHQLCLSDEI